MAPIPTIHYDKFHRERWTKEEQYNVKITIDFVQKIMNDHDFDYIRQNFGKPYYRQHNRSMQDGIEGVLENVEGLTKQFPDFSYDVKRISVDGEYVTLHSHATMYAKDRGNDARGLNIMDIWRVEDGQLVEHWDTLQPLDWFLRFYTLVTGGSICNSNGVF